MVENIYKYIWQHAIIKQYSKANLQRIMINLKLPKISLTDAYSNTVSIYIELLLNGIRATVQLNKIYRTKVSFAKWTTIYFFDRAFSLKVIRCSLFATAYYEWTNYRGFVLCISFGDESSFYRSWRFFTALQRVVGSSLIK